MDFLRLHCAGNQCCVIELLGGAGCVNVLELNHGTVRDGIFEGDCDHLALVLLTVVLVLLLLCREFFSGVVLRLFLFRVNICRPYFDCTADISTYEEGVVQSREAEKYTDQAAVGVADGFDIVHLICLGNVDVA
jgi:hypothetical protein